MWDESSKDAHWKNRAAGTQGQGAQPFFAVFNSTKSHESQIRKRPHTQVHDPAKVRVPAYHPDTPEVRQDWAQYYDTVTEADADAGSASRRSWKRRGSRRTRSFSTTPTTARGCRGTSAGLTTPACTCRWWCYIPEKFKELRPPEYKAGGKSDRLVSFVDLAPTMLSLIGVKPPEWMQGHAFLGKFIAEPQPFLHGFRGRMDERLDLVRSVTDGRYVYVRNYMPHLIYGQHLNYMWQTPTTRVWEQLHKEGKLNAAQDKFWNPKPPEELFDLQSDPDEVKNLADSKEHEEIKTKLRKGPDDYTQFEFAMSASFPKASARSIGRARDRIPYDIDKPPGSRKYSCVTRAIFPAEDASKAHWPGFPVYPPSALDWRSFKSKCILQNFL